MANDVPMVTQSFSFNENHAYMSLILLLWLHFLVGANWHDYY